MPVLPDDLTAMQKQVAHVTHKLLYALLLIQPVTGYLTLAGWRGIFPYAAPAESHLFAYLHALGVAALVAVLSLHILAALRHEFFLQDNVLRRMTPLPRRPEAADRQPPPAPETARGAAIPQKDPAAPRR